jgi:hypothetical protein
MASIDRGWANTVAPLQAPADYFDFTFTAPSATSYHLWIRMRAAGNSKYNDSVFVQLSDARDSRGNPVFAVGSTSGLCVNLATDSAASRLMGWGWQGRRLLADPAIHHRVLINRDAHAPYSDPGRRRVNRPGHLESGRLPNELARTGVW